MLRTPAAFDLPHALDPETSAVYVTFVATACLVTVIASYLQLRRLQIAESWARNNTFPENELVHNIGTLLLPTQLFRLVGLLGIYELGEQSAAANTIGFVGLFITFFCLVIVTKREHALFKQIRKTTASFAKSSGVFIRLFFGYGLLSLFSMLAGFLSSYLLAVTFENSFVTISIFLVTVVFTQLACIPLFARMMLPTTSATGTEVEAMVHEAFNSVRRPRPQVRILALNEFRVFNALILGLGFLPGPFRQSVFISQSTEIPLSTDELKAIIHHELAHSYLFHLPLRVIAAVAINLSLLFIFASLFMVLPHNNALEALEILCYALGLLVVQPILLGRLVRDQETQADEFAVFKMGSRSHDLISAIAKITVASGGLRDRKPAGHWLNAAAAHPTVDERQDHLHQLETQINTGRMASTTLMSRLSSWRFRRAIFQDFIWRLLGGAVVAAIVMVLSASSFKPNQGARAPASASESKAVEKYLRRARG